MAEIGQQGVSKSGKPIVYTAQGWVYAGDTLGAGANPSADQRARLAIQLNPAVESVQQLDQLEPQMGFRERTGQFFDSLDDDKKGIELALTKSIGGDKYQQYQSAAKTFESSLLPIMSGASVTGSEAARQLSAALPQFGDAKPVTADKARRRQQMVNSMSTMAGRPAPFPLSNLPKGMATQRPQAKPPMQSKYSPEQMQTVRKLGKIGGIGGSRTNPRMPVTEQEYNAIPRGQWIINHDGTLEQKAD